MPEPDAIARPHCDRCGVDMWLTRVGDGPIGGHSYLFECKACGARTFISAAQGDTARVEDRL